MIKAKLKVKSKLVKILLQVLIVVAIVVVSKVFIVLAEMAGLRDTGIFLTGGIIFTSNVEIEVDFRG